MVMAQKTLQAYKTSSPETQEKQGFMSKMKASAITLWATALTTMATVGSGWDISLQSSETTEMWNAFLNVAQSILQIFIQLFPYAIVFFGVYMVIKWIWGVLSGR